MKLKNIFLSLLFVILFLDILTVNAQTKIINGDAKNSPIGIAINPVQANIPKNVDKWINAELAKVKTKPITDFDSPHFFNKTNGRLVGYIKGYDVSLGFSTAIVYVKNEITNEDTPVVIQIHPDGRFKGDMPLIMPKYTYLVVDKRWVRFYIEPGQTLSMVLDWDAIKKLDYDDLASAKIDFKGPLAQINKDVNGFDFPKVDYSLYSKIKTMPPNEYKKEQMALLKENLERINQYQKDKSINAKAKVVLENYFLTLNAFKLFEYVERRADEAENDTINPVLKIPVANQYYDFLKELPLNNQSMLVSGEFSSFVNRFEFSKPLNVKGNTSSWKPAKNFLEYFEEEGIAISKEDKELFTSVLNNPTKSVSSYSKEDLSRFIEFSNKYAAEMKAYDKKYVKPYTNPNSSLMESWKNKDSIMTNVFGLKKNLVNEIIKMRSLNPVFKGSNKELSLDYWKTLQKEITNPFLISEGNQIFNKVFGSDSREAYVLPAGRGTDIFNKIIAPFKGKIVLVDFWATSCGPCVGGIRSMKEIREKYEGNTDFEFVFITEDAASPLENYRKFVKEQELKNTFVVHTDDFQYLRELFKFNGIPRSVVIDKNGKVLNGDYFLYNMGVTNFQNELDGFLKASN